MLDFFDPDGGYVAAHGDDAWSEFTGQTDLLRPLDAMTTAALSDPGSPDSRCEVRPTAGPVILVHREAARAFLPVLQRQIIRVVGDARFLCGE